MKTNNVCKRLEENQLLTVIILLVLWLWLIYFFPMVGIHYIFKKRSNIFEEVREGRRHSGKKAERGK